MATLWRQPRGGRVEYQVADRPLLQNDSAGGVRLELFGRDGVWILELDRADAERVAEAIDWEPPGMRYWPGRVANDD